MSTTTRTQHRYDHRLKELVRATGKCEIALESGVPRSTAYGWLTGSHADVVTLDVLDNEVAELQREVVLLRRTIPTVTPRMPIVAAPVWHQRAHPR